LNIFSVWKEIKRWINRLFWCSFQMT